MYNYRARWYNAGLGIWTSVDPMAEKMPRWSGYSYGFNNPMRFVDPNGMAPDDPYLVFNGKEGKLYIYDDNKTKNDRSDDKLLRTYDAHNNVSSKSKGKWEDGSYEMSDTKERHTHGDKTEADGTTLQDSDNGRYGDGGIYRAKSFTETEGDQQTRSGMAVHAGRENKDFDKRRTNGCIRTTCDAMTAIDNAIAANGPLGNTIVQENKHSKNSESINSIHPGTSKIGGSFINFNSSQAPSDNTFVSFVIRFFK